MKKLFLLATIMLASVGAYAQHAVGSFTLQPKVGMTIANLTGDNNSDSRIGFVGGAELEYQATDIFSVSAGVLYSMQGAKYSENNLTQTAKLDYFNVNSKFEASKGGSSLQSDIDAKTVDFSIPVGLSYEYSNVVLDARYNWGLTKTYEGVDSKNSVFQITLGYKFDL